MTSKLNFPFQEYIIENFIDYYILTLLYSSFTERRGTGTVEDFATK